MGHKESNKQTKLRKFICIFLVVMIEGVATVTTDEVAMVMIAVVVVAMVGTDMMTDEVVAMMTETVIIAIGSQSTFNLIDL